MPVRKLLVEGDLDQELLSAFTIIMGGTLIEALKESKYALLPSTRAERRKLKAPVTFYLRDRDFDHEPGLPEHKPTVDKTDKEDGDAILGWRWYRHEIENYLLEPAVVHAATGINVSAFTNALKTAAREIRFYQAARWTIGLSRSHLPRDYELQTRPNKIHGLEFILPEDLSENSMWQWVEESSESFLHVAQTALASLNLTQLYHEKLELFSDAFCDSCEHILIWMSGKDLMKAIEPWLHERGFKKPGYFRAKIRDWIRLNPEEALKLLPEWNQFISMVRTFP